jgi:hypothetical protein
VVWVAVAALAALVVLLLLAALGAMRETSLLRGEVKAIADLVKNPPKPSYVGDVVPAALRQILRDSAASATERTGAPTLVVFVAPGCLACEELVKGLAGALSEGVLRDPDVLVVAWTVPGGGREGARLLSRLSSRTHLDEGGRVATACEIRTTPTLLLVSEGDGALIDYTMGGGTSWVLERMTAAPTSMMV